MPHSGYQRLDAGAMTVMMDTGPPPPPNVSHDAHAGCLSFELSAGPEPDHRQLRHARHRPRQLAQLSRAARAAHSTLTYHDTSSCQFVELRR